jgi:hypothetical protein
MKADASLPLEHARFRSASRRSTSKSSGGGSPPHRRLGPCMESRLNANRTWGKPSTVPGSDRPRSRWDVAKASLNPRLRFCS